ncbi:MAG: radical SAM protein [Planctomycetaceae bacterium]
MSGARNACDLEIELFCRGVRIDPSCRLEEEARTIARTRAGLGSGLELVLPAPGKDLWVNVPVLEPFARSSPFLLERTGEGYALRHDREGFVTPVRLAPRPAWYDRKTSRGARMSGIGLLQGTYLGVYVGGVCRFWTDPAGPMQCRFCSTGLNVGSSERLSKMVEDVVDVCRAAKEESGATFVHLNTGLQEEDGLTVVRPYVRAVREEVGMLVGVQVLPLPRAEHDRYDLLVEEGADHFSFCYEFHDPDHFARHCPGKAARFGQEAFFEAMRYTSRLLGKRRVSGEIVAGIEPIESTLKAIDFITGLGAFPTVCIFRPLQGTAMEDHPPPDPDAMIAVMRHMAEACRRRGIPIGIAPNVEVSLVCQPTDALLLLPGGWRDRLYGLKLAALRALARPALARKLRTPR